MAPFHIWLVSLEKLMGCWRKFYHRCSFGQGSSRYIWKSS